MFYYGGNRGCPHRRASGGLNQYFLERFKNFPGRLFVHTRIAGDLTCELLQRRPIASRGAPNQQFCVPLDGAAVVLKRPFMGPRTNPPGTLERTL